MDVMSYYPIFVEMSGRRVLVVGGGNVAEGKVAGLLTAGAAITLIAPDLTPTLRDQLAARAFEHEARDYRDGDLEGFEVCFVATDDGAVNAKVAAEGKRRGIWVNAADDPQYCDFILPSVVRQIEQDMTALGLAAEPVSIRMTGCPNGCARPYTADLAFVGRSLGLYHVYVGGGLAGDRLVDLYRADVPVEELLPTMRPLLQRWAAERSGGEGLGDFYQRLMGLRAVRSVVTGRELPTIDLVPLEVAR